MLKNDGGSGEKKEEMQRYLQMITLNFALVYAALRDRLNAASIGGET
jgi:hypothetical protein